MHEQNWDYLHIVCEEGRPRYVNRKEIPNWQEGPILFHAVNYLLQNGWELMEQPFAPDPTWRYHPEIPHHFRRPKKKGGLEEN